MQTVVVAIAALLGLVVLVIAGQNLTPEDVHMFGSTAHVPLAVSMVGAWVAGLVATAAVWQQKIKAVKSEKNLQKWEAQDAKLAAEVTSDREKQLQAKIDTLEVALKKARDRNKA